MAQPRKGGQRRTKSGGRVRQPQPAGATPPAARRPQARQPEARTTGPANLVKMLIVHDANGRIVSITRVAPEATHGVGVHPNPGHFVKEVQVPSTLAAQPLNEIPQFYSFDLKTGALKNATA